MPRRKYGGPHGVNVLDPVEYGHPLNRNLLAWWLPLQNTFGGSRLWDVRGLYHGALTGGPTWTTGPGGFGALNLDATDDYAAISLTTSGAWSWGCWYYGTGRNDAWRDLWNTGADYGPHVNSGNQLQFYPGVASTATISLGQWYRFDATIDAADLVSLYINGQPANSGVLAGASASTTWTRIGYFNEPCAGVMTDVTVHARCLSATDVWARYVESRNGFPNLLRRSRPWSFGVEAAGGDLAGTAAITLTGSATLTGAGALLGTTDLIFDDGSTILSGAGALLGTSDLVFDDGTSTLTGSGALLGTSTIVFTESGTILGAGTLLGTAAITFDDGTSVLLGAGVLLGTSTLLFDDGTSTITGVGVLLGSCTVVFLNAGAGQIGLLGTTTLVFSTSLESNPGATFGSSEITVTPTGTILGAGLLTGTSINIFAGSGLIVGHAPILGSLNIVCTPIGLLESTSLVGIIEIVSTVNGTAIVVSSVSPSIVDVTLDFDFEISSTLDFIHIETHTIEF